MEAEERAAVEREAEDRGTCQVGQRGPQARAPLGELHGRRLLCFRLEYVRSLHRPLLGHLSCSRSDAILLGKGSPLALPHL